MLTHIIGLYREPRPPTEKDCSTLPAAFGVRWRSARIGRCLGGTAGKLKTRRNHSAFMSI
jgi:hypothetical protein